MKELFLIALALIGFSVSAYLYYSKSHNKKIQCFIGHDCDDVVKSKYGTTFGVENTLGGMLYYAMIFAYGILLLFNRNLFIGGFVYYAIVIAGICSVLFSAYLTGMQVFVLKKWCEYCIVSTVVSVLILLALII